ncbi:MAG: protein LonB [Deltaproteobacteria bacterium]|nr:MAG: protein LonB [Deltaproteobacteria bacterium]
MLKTRKLKYSDLRCICDPKFYSFKNTAEVTPLDGVIGQERAVQAINFGLAMDSRGYNIFVTGIEGTGKTTIIRDIVTKHAKKNPTPVDWVMVNNFFDEFCPKTIEIPPGKATVFKKQMEKLVEGLQNELAAAFESKSYQKKIDELEKKYGEQQRQIFEALDKKAKQMGLAINRSQSGLQIFPVTDGKPMKREDFDALDKEEKTRIEGNIRELQGEIESSMRTVAKVKDAMQQDVDKAMSDVALFVTRTRIDALLGQYDQCSGIVNYLKEVQKHVVENVTDFLPVNEKTSPIPGMGMGVPESGLQAYEVNVLVDHRGRRGAPVIFETNPTYHNVFGRIEKRAYMGTLTTDFSLVQAGSLLKANGGYLIMEIESLLMNAPVYEALKRALQNKMLLIEDLSISLGFGAMSLRPEPIPLDVKVILLGSYHLFHLLQNNDSKFNKIFKVRADFDHEVIRNDKTMMQYAQFVARVCKQEKLLPLTPTGVAAVVEFGEKQVADKNKLSLRFGSILGVLKEADYWAKKSGARSVSEKYVIKALKEHRFRYNLYEEKTHESYANNTILIDVKGKVVGQVNALAVYQVGDLSFGRPSRITAETFMGRPGIVNIERESKLSGKTHDKGVLILSGFLGRTFAQRYPLNLSVSITFEQSYGGIDGDSASSTELYAILSSLSGIGINQGIAVTGSVNQKGEVQAIGGVNQKVEGFFEVCRTKGLTGRQGVMIPQSNVQNLMVSRDVLKYVKKGKFHIWAVATIEEGIQILTGVPAGKPNKAGNYPKKTVFGKVQKRLKFYLEQQYRLKREFGGEDKNQK